MLEFVGNVGTGNTCDPWFGEIDSLDWYELLGSLIMAVFSMSLVDWKTDRLKKIGWIRTYPFH